MPVFDIEPRISGDVYFGDSRREAVIYAGRVAERGVPGDVYFDASDNFVVLEVGKRGSGKSYGMGSMLEGFATVANGGVGTHRERRGVLLLDPLDIHWTALLPLSREGPEALQRQFSAVERWKNLNVEPIRAKVWLPAGFGWDIDHPDFLPYYLPVSALTADDLALLIRADLLLDTRGRLLAEAHQKTTETGWRAGNQHYEARKDFNLQDLIDCISRDGDIAQFYHAETIRSVLQPLQSYARMPLFSAREGTPMQELVRAGILSVMSLGRLGEDLRTVVTAVIVRKLYHDRSIASQIKRRLQLQSMNSDQHQKLSAELSRHVPRTILAIDEAQILMPGRGGDIAKKALDSYVLQGRNFGLSLWLATQRPKGAVSDAAVSQIDTFIVHRLSVADDISEVCKLLQNSQPQKIRLNGRELDLAGLIRTLDTGQALISSASPDISRLMAVTVRPRMVAHGGEAF